MRDRTGLPDNLDPTALTGEFFIFEIGLSPRLGKRQYDEVYDDIVRAITARGGRAARGQALLPGTHFHEPQGALH